MLNFVVDPTVLRPLVPPGTELDFENGETFLSVVGFLFLDTRLLGLPIPLHRDFEEVNLRFYVRRKSENTWRRGVVFIRELVPRRAIALVARTFYGENYVAVPMKHEIEDLNGNLKVEYSWRRGRKWESLKMNAAGEPQAIPAGSHAEFITEHYWGYTSLRGGPKVRNCGRPKPEAKTVVTPPGVIFKISPITFVSGRPASATKRLPELSKARPRGVVRPVAKVVFTPIGLK